MRHSATRVELFIKYIRRRRYKCLDANNTSAHAATPHRRRRVYKYYIPMNIYRAVDSKFYFKYNVRRTLKEKIQTLILISTQSHTV